MAQSSINRRAKQRKIASLAHGENQPAAKRRKSRRNIAKSAESVSGGVSAAGRRKLAAMAAYQ